MKQVDCLLSTTYAKEWIESFPLGNGHIGIMDNGNPHESVITLNDDTLWSGDGASYDKDVTPEMWAEIREAVDKGNLTKAEKLVHDNVLTNWDDTFLPLGQISISRPLAVSSASSSEHYPNQKRKMTE